MPRFALIGKKLGHSWSKKYFDEKFNSSEWKGYEYINLETDDISTIKHLVQEYRLDGFNVTIPYKRSILPYLDDLSQEAFDIQAVNVVKVMNDGKLKGHNGDAYGFEQSLLPLLQSHHQQALILGSGGASKAVQYILRKLNISFHIVSRSGVGMNYSDLNETIIREHRLIINTTPLGMFPDVNFSPDLPYSALRKEHLLYDLIYNPTETEFLKKAKAQGAVIKNGEEMLILQAERSFELWDFGR